MRRCGTAILGVILVLAAAGPLAPERATASEWCGENGVVHLRFGDEVDGPSVLALAPDELNLTRVTLSAWLADVEPVALNGEAFLSLGGFELELVVVGKQPLSVRKVPAVEAPDLARSSAGCLVGLTESLRLEDAGVKLVSWELIFQGEAPDVRFELKSEGILTCGTTPGCPGSGTRALYIGSHDAMMLGEVFGAGCAPAVLNPAGEPDLAVLRGKSGWRDVGRFEARQKRR
jgi:hypothetical protein